MDCEKCKSNELYSIDEIIEQSVNDLCDCLLSTGVTLENITSVHLNIKEKAKYLKPKKGGYIL